MSTWEDKAGRRHVGIMLNGRRVHRILPAGATEGDAKLIEAELRVGMSRSAKAVNIPGDPPMTAVLAVYVEYAKHLKWPDVSRQHAERLVPWAEKYKASQAREFAAHVIRDMTGAYAAATINRSLATAKKGLTIVWERNLTPDNYGLRIKGLTVNNARDVYLSIEQVGCIAAQASDAVRAAIWIALFTGCRRGEVLSIQPDHVGASEILIPLTNTKTQRSRVIPIVTPLRPWLGALPLPLTFEGLKSGFRRAREKAGMPHVTFHDLRRSCGTLMIQAGVDLYVVSKLLGHSSVAVTQARYGYLQTTRITEGMTKTFG
jgi:integrase